MANGHIDGTVELVNLADLQPGMVRAWNDGLSSVITGISKRTPRSRNRLVSYRSTAARPDGHHNTLTLETPAGSKLPIIAVNPPSAGPCPDNCHACQSGGLVPWRGMPTVWLGVPTVPVAVLAAPGSVEGQR